MRKVLISFIAIITIVGLSYIFKDLTITETNADNCRMVKVLDEGQYEIWCDMKTKVLYLQSRIGAGYQGYGGLTVMVNELGEPLLWKE